MRTKWEHHRDECLSGAISLPEDMAFKKLTHLEMK